RDDGDRDERRPPPRNAHERATRDRAEENRDERSRLDERVARDELVLAQVLRKDAVLDRSEERRVHAHEEQEPEEERRAPEEEPDGREEHEGDLDRLHDANDRRLVEAVGDLARGRREEEERQDEEAGAQVDERVGRQRTSRREREEDDERVPEDVVVER